MSGKYQKDKTEHERLLTLETNSRGGRNGGGLGVGMTG